MAREILYRGKRIDNNEWVFGSHLFDEVMGKHYIVLPRNITESYIAVNSEGEFKRLHCTGSEVIPETVGQYTGLADKDGKKIFEGDVIKDIAPPIILGVGVVKFGNYETKLRSSLITDNYSHHVGFYIIWTDALDLRKDIAFWNNEIEVIGNIHDNPELLEADNG